MGIKEITDRWCKQINVHRREVREKDMKAVEERYNEHAYRLSNALWELSYFRPEGLTTEVAEARKLFEKRKGAMFIETPANEERPKPMPGIDIFQDIRTFLAQKDKEKDLSPAMRRSADTCIAALSGMEQCQQKYDKTSYSSAGGKSWIR